MNRAILELHTQLGKIYAMAEGIYKVIKIKHSEDISYGFYKGHYIKTVFSIHNR